MHNPPSALIGNQLLRHASRTLLLVLAFGVNTMAVPPIITNTPASQTVFIGDPVTFRVGAAGAAPLSYQWFRGGTPLSGATSGELIFTTAAADDNALFTVHVANSAGSVTSAPAALTIDFGMPGPAQTNRLVETTSVWRYEVSKANLGTNWTTAGYADATWAEGAGLLYVEESALPAPKTTALPLIPGSLPTTCYFRTRFTNDIVNAYAVRLEVNTVIDDGVVCHLNGEEVFRNGVADGDTSYDTPSNRTVGNAAWEGPFDFPVTHLIAGVNVLSAEVHQVNATSSDIVMGLTLDAIWQPRLRSSNAPVVVKVSPTPGMTLSTLRQIEVQFSGGVRGVDAADLWINGVPATNVTVVALDDYLFQFPSPTNGVVSVSWAPTHGITDRSVNSNAFTGTGFGYLLGSVSSAARLVFSGVRQSTDAAPGNTASQAVDGSTAKFSLTKNLPGSYWLAELGRAYPLERIELVNRPAPDDKELEGLTLRLFNMDDQIVFETVLTNPGSSGIAVINVPVDLSARSLWIGLTGTQTNGAGNYRVGLAEVRLFGALNIPYGPPSASVATNNLASFKPCSMLRLDTTVPVATRANDNNFSTETKTTQRTVDGYWEVDLGATYALYGVRSVAASGISFRLTNAIVRLYDAAHESIFAKRITGTPDTFDTDLNGPVFARYVRVGLEDKQRTDPAGGIEFYIGFREVEVFGRPTNEVGILSFTASTNQVTTGQSVTLSWAVEDVRRVEIYPTLGSVGGYTTTNGMGSITVTPTNSTEFILVASNTAGLFSRAVGVHVGSTPLPVRISEFVAENKYSLKDGFGDASDWIELRNTGNAAVNLLGWGLSDDPAQPMKWTFPATNLEAHSTLVVFASGRDTPLDPSGNLHANFRLEKNGGALVLCASDGVTVVDSLPSYPEQDTDLAYGRDLAGHWTFLEPTPGLVNAAPSYLGWLKPLDWSHARGFYDSAFTLTLTNLNPGATVLYSLNGSAPLLPYTRGLSITGTKAVRAVAVQAGYKPARIQTKTFLFVNDVITSSVMNTTITRNPAYASRMRPGLLALPTISISVPGQPEYEEKEGSLELLWPNGEEPVQVNCGISRFGNAWTKFEKRSFRMKCRTRYGEARMTAPLFNAFDRGVLAKTSFDELDLRSGSQDMVERGFYMAGRFVEDSMLDMGSLNPHGRFVHVYINGVYWGQYDCRELLVDRFMADYLGGDAEDYMVVRGNDNVTDDFVLGAPEPPNIKPWEDTRSLNRSYNAVRSHLDVSHLIDFMLLWNYGDCESEFRCCGPIKAGSGFKFWIADADGFLRTSALGLNRTDRTGPGGLFGGLVTENNSDFKALLADRIYRHFFNQGALTPAANDARLAKRMQEIHDSLLAECARWNYRTPANWESSATQIRSSLFPTRTTQLFGYLRSRKLYPAFDPPAFNQFGGLVTNGFLPTLTSSSGTIYYTLNGSDPRLPGGDISPTALIWTNGAVTITSDLILNVRVRNSSSQWSALAQPHFLLASRRAPTARDLLITEINYNPAGSDDFEFVELYNASTNLLDLSGVSLSNAVRFVFPNGFALAPGAFVMVVENTASFAALYQTPDSPYYFPELTVAGEWGGALGNTGDTVSLVASNGVPLSAVPYQTSSDWPDRANGKGSSLELDRLPAATATDAEVQAFLASGWNWTSSSLYHGSPGRLDPFVKSVRLNEILSHPDLGADWLELLNTGTQPVDLTDCTLTDTMDLPTAWTFPTNTVLQPGQFKVISSTQLGFAFSERGDKTFLLQMLGTNIMRFLDSVDFSAADTEESFGLFQRSDGTFDFTEQRTTTRGLSNGLPRVGPVVISEIMAVPTPGMAEYVELTSLTNTALPLYDPLRPTNVWTLEGVGSFSFPTGTVLQGCSSLIVCSTNAAAFRTQYGLAASVPVFGPWSGTLNDDGETLKLLRPGMPELDGTVPYYRVDHVTYRTNGAWSQARASGSLERIPIQAYGNDPASWRAGPTNGSPGFFASNRPPVVHVVGELAVSERTPMTLTVSVADPDAPWQGSALWPTRLPPGSRFDETSGVFSWTPGETQGPGNYQAEFVATDDAACGALTTVTPLVITVKKANQPPAWAPQSDVWFPAGLSCVISLTASDPDLPMEALSFQASGLPTGFRLDTSPLRIVGIGVAAGDYPIDVTVSDGQTPPLQATLRFAIHLTEPFALETWMESGAIWLKFPAIRGETYRVEWCNDLAVSDWRTLQAATVAQTNIISVLDSAPSQSLSRFYRVLWVR